MGNLIGLVHVVWFGIHFRQGRGAHSVVKYGRTHNVLNAWRGLRTWTGTTDWMTLLLVERGNRTMLAKDESICFPRSCTNPAMGSHKEQLD